MACDICGKTGTFLVPLLSLYQTDDIKEICSECEKKVNDHLWKMKEMSTKMNTNFLIRFMENWKRKGNLHGKDSL